MHRDFDSIIVSLENNAIVSAEDLSQLSDNDMEQLGMPLGLKTKVRQFL
jgi:hypothetical protein